MLELSIRFVVALDQCVLLIRRSGKEVMIGMFVLAIADSPEVWRMAWVVAALILATTFLRVMVGYEYVSDDSSQ
jgi:hypothetical protein